MEWPSGARVHSTRVAMRVGDDPERSLARLGAGSDVAALRGGRYEERDGGGRDGRGGRAGDHAPGGADVDGARGGRRAHRGDYRGESTTDRGVERV